MVNIVLLLIIVQIFLDVITALNSVKVVFCKIFMTLGQYSVPNANLVILYQIMVNVSKCMIQHRLLIVLLANLLMFMMDFYIAHLVQIHVKLVDLKIWKMLIAIGAVLHARQVIF